MDILREYIQNLNDVLTSNSNNEVDVNTANNILNNIEQLCLSEPLLEKDTVFACSILFHGDTGLLKFLSVTTNDKKFDTAKSKALVIITEFFKRFKEKLNEYVINAQDVCFIVFLRCSTAAVRKDSLLATAKIIEIYYGTNESKKFKIDEKVKQLFMQLTQASKLPPLVKQEIYNILGVLARYYPESVNEKNSRILAVFLNELKVQMTSKVKKLDSAVVTGCFQGLTGFLYNFTVSAEEDPIRSRTIYDYARSVLNSTQTLGRYEIYRSALQLLASHAAQFVPYLYADYEKMYNCLDKWSRHNNRETRAEGFKAMDSFLREISENLISNATKGDRKSAVIFKFFILKFKDVITSEYSTENRHAAISIKGYGLFAPACKYFPDEKGLVNYMFMEMLQRTEYLKNRNEIVLEEKMGLLPSYVESLSSIIKEMDGISEVHLSVLEQIAVYQMEHFPYMATNFQFLCYKSLICLFLSLQSKKNVFNYFLQQTLYQSLVRTCSHPILAESEIMKDAEGYTMEEQFKMNQRIITYRNYLDLWFQLLDILSMKELNLLTYTIEERRQLMVTIYDELVSSVMSIIKKLDLNAERKPMVKRENVVEKELESFQTADPVLGLEAVNPKDFRIFINLVDFSRDVFLKKKVEFFEKWLYTFGLEMVKQSSRLPHVSGFYKLVAMSLKIAFKRKYFVNRETHSERQAFFNIIVKFSKEVAIRFQQFKDDLLASCLEVILSLPAEIVLGDLNSFIPALQTTFKLGLGYLPIANLGLEALETWSSSIPLETLEVELFPKVLPLLVKYLSAGTTEEKSRGRSLFEVPKRSKSRGAKSEILKKVKATSRPGEKFAEDFQLTSFRLRVLKFLGSLGGHYNRSALHLDSEEVKETAIAWDIVKRDHLKFAVPFADIKLDIFLDDFLPQVVFLALNSGNRQTKVTACELLHALILFMVGKGSQERAKQNPISMAKLYDRVFPASLTLACDVEDTARQLFEPLTIQLIHWFTNKINIFSEETKSLNNSIWGGITNVHDTKLRDFSANCLREFVQWAIKQSSAKDLKSAGYGMKSVVDKIYSYSSHPNSAKRLAASLAFNNIYTVLREEDAFIRKFSLKLTVHFVDSLAISHHDPKALGTQIQCKQALEHLERILIAKADMLEKTHESVEVPSCLDDGTFGSLLSWLLTRTASTQTESRHVCMELVSKLSCHYKDFKTSKDYVQNLYSIKGVAFFHNLYESKLSNSLDDLNLRLTLSMVVNWMERFMACIEAYSWLVGQDLVAYEQLFSVMDTENYFLKSIELLLTKIAPKTIEEYFSVSAEEHEFSPKEILDYNHLKCSLVVRLMSFTSIICRHYNFRSENNCFFNRDLWVILGLTVLSPTKLDFDLADLEVSSNLPDEVSALLLQLKKYLPKEILEDFQTNLRHFMSENDDLNLAKCLPSSMDKDEFDYLKLNCLIKGLNQLAKILGFKIDSKTLADSLLNLVWSCGNCTELSQFPLQVTSQIIHLLFHHDYLRVKDLVSKLATEDKALSVFMKFKKEFCSYMAQYSKDTINLLVSNIAESGSLNSSSVLVIFLELIVKEKDLRKNYGLNIFEEVISHWNRLAFLWLPNSSQDQANLAFVILTKVLLINSKMTSGVHYEKLFKTFSTLLKRQSTELGFKSQVLDLLPFFIEAKETLEQLKMDIEQFSSDNLPLDSREFVEGSAKRNDYVSILRKFFQALALTGSCILLETTTMFVCRENNHLLADDFQKCLSQTLKRKHPKEQLELLKTAFCLWKNEQRSFEFRRQVAFKVLLPLLRQTNLTSFELFYQSHIIEIMAILKTRLIKYPENDAEECLLLKCVAFDLMTLLYTRLQKESLSSKESAINAAYCLGNPVTGKELTTDITRLAHGVKKEDTSFSPNLKELCRLYHCSGYNTITSIICCTQSEEKFYTVFLFSENKTKGEYLWDNLIDQHKEYTFEAEIEDNENLKKLAVLRRSVRRDDGTEAGRGRYASSLRYLSSKYLSESSLSEDVSQFDFSSSQRVFNKPKKKFKSTAEDQISYETLRENETGSEKIELELDELNLHECMRNMVSLVDVMYKHTIISNETEVYNLPLPKFLDAIIKKLEEPLVHRNVKLFLTRFIVLVEKFLKPYAAKLSESFLKLIGAGVYGSELDPFVVDVLLLAMEWSNLAKIEVSNLTATEIVKFLMQKCAHERRDIFRRNLEIVKLAVEYWSDKITPSYRTIYDLLTSHKRQKIVGIQLLGVLLANKLPPFQTTPNLTRDIFLKAFLNNISNEYKEIYAPSCEVTGMILSYMEEREVLIDEIFHDSLVKILTDIGNNPSKKQQFLNSVSYVCLHFPSLADNFFSKLLFFLPTAQGSHVSKILETIRGRVEKFSNAFQELRSKGLLKLLEHTSEETDKILVLQILTKLVGYTEPEQLAKILPITTDLSKFRTAVSRDSLYTLFIELYKKYANTMDEDNFKLEIFNSSKEVLLQGLTDSENTLRLRCCNFWSEKTQLPTEAIPRMESLLLDMYSPLTEQQFLQYSSYLFLEMASKSPDYNRKIYDTPLSECKFENYKIALSWRQRHIGMTPLFSDSFTNLSSLSGSVGDFAVKATQNNQAFSATQDDKGNIVDWLTNSSVDTFANQASLVVSSLSSSLLFSPGPKRYANANQKQLATKNQPSHEGDNKLSELKRLRRRFLKNHESNRKYFMKAEIRKKEMREETRKDQITRREAQVTMYRQYRIGELPDIEISYNNLIAPMQALAQQDSKIAKILMCKIVLAIASELKNQSRVETFESFSKSISDALNNILLQSSQFSPSVVAFAQEVLYNHVENINLTPENVATASRASHQQNTGILLLEAYVSKKASDIDIPPSRKRMKLETSITNSDVVAWIKLAELYKSLNNYDMVRSIFSIGVKIQSGTQEAMDLEANGDDAAALIIYNQLYEGVDRLNDSSEIEQAEINYWDDSILKCYERLTSWEKLEKAVTNRLPNSDNLVSVWDDPFSQEHFLPHLVKSKLKNILNGCANQDLLTFVDLSLKDKDKKLVIEGKFPEELATLYAIQENYKQALYYNDLSLRTFLEEWSGLSILTPGVRNQLFMTLQQLAEMDQFLSLGSKTDKNPQALVRIIEKWEQRLPDFTYPSRVWDDVILNRQFYFEKLLPRPSASTNLDPGDCLVMSMSEDIDADQDTVDFREISTKAFIRMKLSMVDSACSRNNVSVANKNINWITEKVRHNQRLLPESWVKCIHTYCKIHHLKASKQRRPKRIDTLLGVWQQLEKLQKDYLSSSDLKNKISHQLYVAENLDLITEELKISPDSFEQTKSQKKADFLNTFDTQPIPQLIEKISKKSFESLKKALAYTKQDSKQSETEATSKLVNFCNKRLRDIELTSEEADEKLLKMYSSTFVESLFACLRAGDHKAVRLIPRAVNLLESRPSLVPIFVKNAQRIPCWMFLSSLDDLLALLDQPTCEWIQPFIMDICDTYPNALIYPFKVASENYNFKDNSEGQRMKTFVSKVEAKLSKLVLVNEFLVALNYLRTPHLILKDTVLDIQYLKLMKTGQDEIDQVVHKTWNDVFNIETSGRRPKLGGFGGNIHSEFSKRFRDVTVKKYGNMMNKLGSLNKLEFSDAMRFFNEMKLPRVSKLPLDNFSSWLSKFQSFQHLDEIEIPGQYDGMTKPMPEYHVKIVGFDQTVIVLQSIEIPRKLTIRGNDEKEYSFLVKFGEDLRQDQRIQKAFQTMNYIYAHDSKCASDGLNLKTYNVIPLSSRYGLIQWVDNTVTFKHLIGNYVDEDKKGEISNLFFEWAGVGMNLLDAKNIIKIYENAYLNRNDKETIDFFNSIKNRVDFHLYRTIFLSISSCLEAFCTLRSQFAKCHAVMSVSHWIMGIGDRHLNNSLLKTDTAEEVGIDFGHAFGSATQKLVIPELIPFRLTPQFLNLMSPMGSKGLVESTMIFALDALRNNQDSLIDILDIFIKAPTTEWMRCNKSLKHDSSEDASVDNQYATEKVEIAWKKLNGANPAFMTIADLKLNTHIANDEFLNSLIKITKGNSQSDIRAQLSSDNLTTKEQVLCLIDQATDPKILGRTYSGWEPWI